MCGRALAVLLVSFLAVSSAFPQCTYTNAYSGEFRASYLDLVTNANEVWTATGYGMQLFDSGRFVQSLPVPGTTRVIRLATGVGAYAGSGSSIYLISGTPATGGLRIGGSVDTGGTVNDIIVTPNYLYAATNAGLQQYDLLNPAAPVRTPATFATTTSNVTSLALSGSLLYATDGDNTVGIFDVTVPALPQKTGQLLSLPRSTSVHVTATGDPTLFRVYVSDGQNTDVFVGSGPAAVKAATVPFGTTAFAPLTGDVVFAAGTDRRIHAIDWTNAAAPVEIFATDVLPSGGTINRAAAMAISGGALVLAAGDAGLQVWDVNGFTAPFPVRSYTTGATTSVLWAGGKLYAARSTGGISEFTKSSSGALTAARQWDSRVHTLYDSNNGFLLSSTGSLLTDWTLVSQTPVLASSASFRSNIVSGAIVNSTAYAVLDDRTLWTADLSQTSPTPQPVAISGTNPSSIARSGNALAIADIRDDGTTAVSYFPSADLTKPPQTVSVPGTSTTVVALSGSTAAVFTFRGINLIDFGSGSVSVLPQSNDSLAQALALTGSQLLELTDTTLRVWDPATGKLVREFPLPVGGSALAVDQMAGIATPAGVAGVVLDSTSTSPRLVSTRGGNAYYRKIAAVGDRLYLFDGRTIDIFSTTFGAAPRYVSSVQPPGIVDFAVSTDALFAVSNSRTITAYSRDGTAIAQAALNEGSDVQPIAIATAAGVPWISISKGCLTGSCQQQTVVLDPRSLVRTALLDGPAVDVTGSGTRAWAIFNDLPASIRVYDTTDPLHPSALASRAAEGSAAPVSIAESNGTVYVLGEKLYAYDEAGLTKSGEQFASYQPDLAGVYAYVDQRIRIDGGCGLVSGRSASPQLFAVPQWIATAAPAVPASVRSVAAVPGRLYLLTDDSVEVWSTQPPPAPSRRHVTR